jgi:hypothetical protein
MNQLRLFFNPFKKYIIVIEWNSKLCSTVYLSFTHSSISDNYSITHLKFVIKLACLMKKRTFYYRSFFINQINVKNSPLDLRRGRKYSNIRFICNFSSDFPKLTIISQISYWCIQQLLFCRGIKWWFFLFHNNWYK